MSINIAIVDDDRFYLDRAEKIIRKHMDEESINIYTFEAPKKFLESEEEYNIVFLDIVLGDDINGMDIAEQYRYINKKALIILISSLMDYLVDGYRVDAFRFIVKYEEREEAQYKEALNKAEEIITADNELIEFDTPYGEKVSVPLQKIKYITTVKRQVEVHTELDTFMAKGTVREYAKILEEKNFISTHVSYLVNLWWIYKNELVLKNGEKLPVSRKMKKEVNHKFIRYKARCM